MITFISGIFNLKFEKKISLFHITFTYYWNYTILFFSTILLAIYLIHYNNCFSNFKSK